MKNKNALVFRIKCIAKKCRETGKWDLLSRLCYKYSWIDLTAGEADKKIIELRDKIEEDRERYSYDRENLKAYCQEEIEQRKTRYSKN